ncbi:MAG TPA: GNAT family N-acetyltransferase [Acidimicrobiales bacterium]|nr:GNAT family N-acetyltransferase [Acidimicrobiales bacterium]
MPRRRLGVALLLPEPVATEVDALRRAVGGEVHRIAPHITLVPPVNVGAEHLDDAVGVLRAAAADTRPFRLPLGPTATFLPDNPVLFLPVDDDAGEVRRLRDAVFTEPLARHLTWPFHPHVTLLDSGGADEVRAAAAALREYRAEVVLERVHLLEERRDDEGERIWRPIADASFRRPGVVGRGGLPVELEVSERPSPSVARWLVEAWASYSRDQYGDDVVPDEAMTVTARRHGKVVGAATGHVRGAEAYLGRLITDPTVRGEGIGTHLLAAFTDVAVARGCDRVTLRTIAGGLAERFYREHGYVTAAPLPEWRHGRDFVQLVRHL